MIPKEDADIVNLWKTGEVLNTWSILINDGTHAEKHKLTMLELW
ncbi:hypothetical protein [Chryseobacterium sp.]